MNTFNILFHLMLADFLERARRPGIWLVAALGIGFGYLFLPPADSQTLMLALGPWRGVYNSAWVGVVFGLLAVMILPLFAFYAVKNSISRDRDTRVGQIIASTPVKRPLYLLGKWLSNLAVLAILLAVLSVMAVAMQLVRGEATAVQPVLLLAPLWLLGLPVMALVAAVALLFESLPLFSGGVGNIVYFFGWFFYLGGVALPGVFQAQIGWISPRPDLLGVSRPIAALQTFAATVDPAYNGHFNFAGASYGRLPTLVLWPGMSWSGIIIVERLLWLAVAVGMVLLTALFFDRFDPARTIVLWSPRRKRRPTAVRQLAADPNLEPAITPTQLSAGTLALKRPSLAALLQAELGLMLHGRPYWLYGTAALITLIGVAAPVGDGPPVAALAWLWPLLLWAELGTRSRTYHTHTLVFAAPEPRRAQFWAPWLAGVALALAATAVLVFKAVASGSITQGLGMLIGALFVPSLALACGVWSGNGRLFQVVYLLWWFSAAVGNTWLDFMAYGEVTAAAGTPLVYLCLAVLLLLAAYMGETHTRKHFL